MRPLALALLLLAAGPLAAQPSGGTGTPLAFGMGDSPLEPSAGGLGRFTARAAVYAGPAFLGASWRTVGAFEADARRGRFSAGLGGTLHAGFGGLYDPETDEAYDLARLVRYVRHNPGGGLPVYARLGPTRSLTLGSGHLARGYTTTTAWDERRLGAEAALETAFVSAGAFSDDVLGRGVVGAQVALRPLGASRSPRLASLELAGAAVHDLRFTSETGGDAPTAFSAEVSADAFRFAEFAARPWVSYAEYRHFGRGAGAGVEAGSDNIADLARAHVRLGLFYSSDGFIPGHFNPFYRLSNGLDRIVTADSFYDGVPGDSLAGTLLADAEGGLDWTADVRLVVFETFELAQHFRRHYGSRRQSAYSLALAFRPPANPDLRFELALERQGLGSVFSVFSGLEDQNALVLDLGYRLGPALLLVRSRYGYRRLDAEGDGPADGPADGPDRYLVQRRFEPMAGLSVQF